ncbi:MmgE/PrpD family protein [Bosea sp. (in: a-proteobacteria)]|uniref:MmgE/PrpD family protein n=1 Tax=Bosea sp. (in: a-proteobacteria) TaxID=1871050 RepID=UPI002612F5AF|nr:MmgE/PrpD family protein [Bosea sp. (in: a-proteobacteria)]MCO5090374.1 MmgE/PrpD family protein [Bosea sp. (in: a-proteobacteria)]
MTTTELANRYGPRVADHAATAMSRPLPEEVREKARLHLLDTLAAIVSGARLEAGMAGQRYAQGLQGPPVAAILGTALRAPLAEAVLANGMAAHADESDDSHEDSQTHPGCGVVPAAISVADELASSGEALLRSVVLGYEMTIRFARAFGSGMTFKSSSMSSHAYGPLFGAGYAAGALMGFEEQDFAALLNYLAQEASGLTTWRLDKAHTLKSYVFAGMPAMNGAKAAALVRAGFTGGGDALDMSDRNMLDAICPSPRPEALTEGLGTLFTILETDIKKYPIGYPIAAPVAALETIIAEHAPRPADVTAIRTYYNEDWYKVVGDKTLMPDVNMRYCLAITMLDGRLTFDASHDAARMHDDDVVAMGRRIQFLGPTPGLERFAVEVEVDAGGRTYRAFQDRNVLGRFENPMTRAQVEAKALELLVTALPAAQAREVVALTARIEELRDVRELIRAMTIR